MVHSNLNSKLGSSLFAVVLLTGVGCKNTSLVGLNTMASPPPSFDVTSFATAGLNFCTSLPQKLNSYIKFTFFVDKSGSNFQDYDSSDRPIPGTDPFGTRRYDPLISFVSTLPDDPSNPNTYFFRLVNFSDQAVDVIGGFTSDRSYFMSVLEAQRDAGGGNSPADGGWTNYLAAVGMGANIVSSDINAAKAAADLTSTAYIDIMVTDGQPLMASGYQDQGAIDGVISAIKALQPANKAFVDSIQFNTAYYFNSKDAGAVSRLTDMAAQGGGSYYEFSSGQALDFTKFALPTRQIRHSLVGLYVLNKNTVWDSTGHLVLSTAGDGVPDWMKKDPTKADQDNNGVSDLVEKLTSGNVCKDSSCSLGGAADYDLRCSAFLSQGQSALTSRYLLPFKFGLNECEIYLLGGAVLSWYSTLAVVPDALLARSGLSIAVGSNAANLDPFLDKMTNAQKIKLNAPTQFSLSSIANLKLQSYNVAQTQAKQNQDCYSVQVNNIATILKDAKGNSVKNTIAVWEIETDSILGNKYYMQYAEQELNGSSATFQDADLK